MAHAIDIGERIRTLRKRHGFSVEGLAEVTGLSAGHVSKLERSLQMPTVRTLDTLADALGLEMVDLVIDPDASARDAVIEATGYLSASELRALEKQLAEANDDPDGRPRKARRTSRLRRKAGATPRVKRKKRSGA